MPEEVFLAIFLVAATLFVALTLIGNQEAKWKLMAVAWIFGIIATAMIPLTYFFGT